MPNFSEESEERFKEFVEKTKKDLIARVTANKDRFHNAEKLLCRYHDVVCRVTKQRLTNLREFHEVHNELCTASVILEDKSEPNVTKLEYEPKIDGCDKRFDFHAVMSKGPVRYIEVKTIHPMSQDDWDKYQASLKNRRFPPGPHLIFDNEWLGGELYHNSYAARCKMLDYALVAENQIEKCLSNTKEKVTFLVLFTNGFNWHLDELEDFLFFYFKGIHFPGDPFAQMEDYDVKEKKIQLKRTIDHFAYFRRPKTDMKPNKVIWSVKVPCIPY